MTTPPEPAGQARAALYARVSTDEQADKYGLASQLRELRTLASRKGYAVPQGAEYIDDGYSGADLNRPALTRLREAIRARAVEVVLIHDPDRLARKLGLQVLLMEEFERARIDVEFATITREATPEGALLLQVKGVIAEYERAKITERTSRGRREKARRGLLVNGYPYGFRADPVQSGHAAIHDDEAAVVRMIYAWLIDEQRSVRQVVDELRKLGVPARRARQWAPTSVRRILTSELYTGRAYYNRHQSIANPTTGKNTRRASRPEAEWIKIDVPAIVTPERFAAAQAQLVRNRAFLVGRPATQNVWLLRGLLRCGACGARYASNPSHGHRYYRCYGRDRLSGRQCRAKWLSAGVVEATVWDAITGVLKNPAVLFRAMEGHAARIGVREVELRSAVHHLTRQLADVERQEHKLLDLYLDESLRTDALRGRLEELARRRQGLREQLTRGQAQADAQRAAEGRHEAIARWCAVARRGLKRLDAQGRQRLLGELVDEVIVRGRELEIHGILPAREAHRELRRLA